MAGFIGSAKEWYIDDVLALWTGDIPLLHNSIKHLECNNLNSNLHMHTVKILFPS